MTSTNFRQKFRKRRAVFLENLDSMGRREKRIIILRYGIGYNAIPMTLQEVSEQVGISRQRVKQIEDDIYQRISSK